VSRQSRARDARAADGQSAQSVRRSDLRPRQPMTDTQLLAAAKRAALVAERKAAKAQRAEGQPRSFH
jgi:hypothetical protein